MAIQLWLKAKSENKNKIVNKSHTQNSQMQLFLNERDNLVVSFLSLDIV